MVAAVSSPHSDSTRISPFLFIMSPLIPSIIRPSKFVLSFLVVSLFSLCLASSGYTEISVPRSEISRAAFQRLAPELKKEMQKKNLQLGQPIFLRIFKEESELEVWVKKGVTFELFKTFNICKFSGDLGPKMKEGDKQSPEGFYTVRVSALNPWSDYHLSFNLGYPNEYDRIHNYTGGALMVHGKCESVGCFAMEDYRIEEIYTLIDAAMTNGQDQFSVHIFPFRMTWHNLAQYADSPWVPFWENLKQGYDFFHGHRNPPLVTVTDGRYVFQDFRPFIFGGDLIPAQEAVEKVIVAVETKPSGDKEQKIVEIKPSSAKKYITVAKKSSNDRKIAAIGKKPLKNRSAL